MKRLDSIPKDVLLKIQQSPLKLWDNSIYVYQTLNNSYVIARNEIGRNLNDYLTLNEVDECENSILYFTSLNYNNFMTLISSQLIIKNSFIYCSTTEFIDGVTTIENSSIITHGKLSLTSSNIINSTIIHENKLSLQNSTFINSTVTLKDDTTSIDSCYFEDSTFINNNILRNNIDETGVVTYLINTSVKTSEVTNNDFISNIIAAKVSISDCAINKCKLYNYDTTDITTSSQNGFWFNGKKFNLELLSGEVKKIVTLLRKIRIDEYTKELQSMNLTKAQSDYYLNENIKHTMSNSAKDKLELHFGSNSVYVYSIRDAVQNRVFDFKFNEELKKYFNIPYIVINIEYNDDYTFDLNLLNEYSNLNVKFLTSGKNKYLKTTRYGIKDITNCKLKLSINTDVFNRFKNTQYSLIIWNSSLYIREHKLEKRNTTKIGEFNMSFGRLIFMITMDLSLGLQHFLDTVETTHVSDLSKNSDIDLYHYNIIEVLPIKSTTLSKTQNVDLIIENGNVIIGDESLYNTIKVEAYNIFKTTPEILPVYYNDSIQQIGTIKDYGLQFTFNGISDLKLSHDYTLIVTDVGCIISAQPYSGSSITTFFY